MISEINLIIPTVTILITVYNGEQYLAETIKSIFSQSYQDFEILIIDDDSKDNTQKILKSFIDKRIRLIINEKRIGLPLSLNKGIKLATGKYIARLDSDDLCFKHRLAKQVDYLNTHPECGIIAGKVKLIDENGNECGIWPADNETVSKDAIINTLPFYNCIAQSAVMGRTEIFKRYLYDEKFSYGEDYELWMRLVGNNIIIEKINEYIVYHRIHKNNLTYAFEKKRTYKDNYNDLRKNVLQKMNFLSNPLFFLILLYAFVNIEKGKFIETCKILLTKNNL